MIDNSNPSQNPILNVVFEDLYTTTSSTSDDVMSIQRQENGRFSPGFSGYHGGSKPNTASISYWLRSIVSQNNGSGARMLAEKALEMGCEGRQNFIELIFDRIDGKVPNNLNVQSVVVHLGNEYARLGMSTTAAELDSMRQQYLPMPSASDNTDS